MLESTARIILHGGHQARAAITAALGLRFSDTACTAVVSPDGSAALWLGPDEYLLLDQGHAASERITALEQAVAGVPHALVDVSHRQVTLEISGPHAEAI